MTLTPEEFLAKQKTELKTELKSVEQGVGKRFILRVLRSLAPVYGYSDKDVYRVGDVCKGDDLLEAFRQDPVVGNKIPYGLLIGGHRGLRYGNLLHKDFRNYPWWKKFRGHMDTYGEVIWVLPIQSAGYWVLHNISVTPAKQQPAIIIPARRPGLNHVRVMRLEAFIEEHRNE